MIVYLAGETLFVMILLQVFKNLKLFMKNKEPGNDLFDRLQVNIHFFC